MIDPYQISFFMASYGAKHSPFVYACVESILRHTPSAEIIVFWSDMDLSEVLLIQSMSPRIRMYERAEISALLQSGAHDQIVSQKMKYWSEALDVCHSEYILFCDTDVFFTQDVSRIIDPEVDLTITYREKKIPLNTGVVVAKNSDRIKSFIKDWEAETVRILSDQHLSELAIDQSGGADQHALEIVAQYRRQKSTYTTNGIVINPVSCALLNEIRCVPLTDRTHVFHLKGGWHPLILDAKSFSSQRPGDQCRHILELWIELYVAGSRRALRGFEAELDPVGPVSHVRRFTDIAARLQCDTILVATTSRDDCWPADWQRVLPDRLIAEGIQASTQTALWIAVQDPQVSAAIASKVVKSTRHLIVVGAASSDHLWAADEPALFRSEQLIKGQPPTYALPGWMDFQHRRRRPDWAGMLVTASRHNRSIASHLKP